MDADTIATIVCPTISFVVIGAVNMSQEIVCIFLKTGIAFVTVKVALTTSLHLLVMVVAHLSIMTMGQPQKTPTIHTVKIA